MKVKILGVKMNGSSVGPSVVSNASRPQDMKLPGYGELVTPTHPASDPCAELRALITAQGQELLNLKAAVEELAFSNKNLKFEIHGLRSELSEKAGRIKALEEQQVCGVGGGVNASTLKTSSPFSSSAPSCPAPAPSVSSAIPKPLQSSTQAIGAQSISSTTSTTGPFPGQYQTSSAPSATQASLVSPLSGSVFSTDSQFPQPTPPQLTGPPASPFPAQATSYGPPPPIHSFAKTSVPQSTPPPPIPNWKKRAQELHGHEVKKPEEGYGVREFRELMARQVDPNFDPVQYAVEKSRGQYNAKYFDFTRYPQPPKKEPKSGMMYNLVGWIFD